MFEYSTRIPPDMRERLSAALEDVTQRGTRPPTVSRDEFLDLLMHPGCRNGVGQLDAQVAAVLAGHPNVSYGWSTDAVLNPERAGIHPEAENLVLGELANNNWLDPDVLYLLAARDAGFDWLLLQNPNSDYRTMTLALQRRISSPSVPSVSLAPRVLANVSLHPNFPIEMGPGYAAWLERLYKDGFGPTGVVLAGLRALAGDPDRRAWLTPEALSAVIVDASTL